MVVETIEEEMSPTSNPVTSTAGPTLPSLVQALYEKWPAYTVELFIRQGSEARENVFESDDSLSTDALIQTDVYQSTTVYQYKRMLQHSGILHPETTANSTDKLSPTDDYWTLRNIIP